MSKGEFQTFVDGGVKYKEMEQKYNEIISPVVEQESKELVHPCTSAAMHRSDFKHTLSCCVD